MENFGKASQENRESEEIHYNRFCHKQAIHAFISDLKQDHFSELMLNISDEVEKEYQTTIDNFDDDKLNSYEGILAHEYRDDKQLALSEMIIVYNYKEYEINVKRLLKLSYGENGKGFFQYQHLLKFLESKEIDITKISGVKEVNELRLLNNHIKHSNSRIVGNKIKNIPEFKGKDYIDSDDINKFYNRIKDFPLIFLDALSEEISNDLFEFNEKRIESMAKEYARRMEKSDAQLFIKKLNNLY